MTKNYGLIAGISDTEYHADKTSLSSSGARKVLACPARFKWDLDNPTTTSAALEFGKLAHAVVLNDGVSNYLAMDPNIYGLKKDGTVADVPQATSAWKQAVAEAAEHGVTPVSMTDYNTAFAMRDAVMKHPVASGLFKNGIAELSGYWQDEPTDVRLRFRPDWMTTSLSGRVVCVDYKTTINANPSDFAASVAKFGYHQQQAWYQFGLAAHSIDDAGFLFLAQEKQPPYPVSVIELHPDAVRLGAQLNRKAIDLYANCLESGEWPAYGTGINLIDLPKWAYYRGGNND